MRVISAYAAVLVILLFGMSQTAVAIGPSYPCSRASTPMERFICSDPELSKTDLIFVQPYYALRHQMGPSGWQALKIEAIKVANEIAASCGLSDPAGPLPSDLRQLKACFIASYARQAAAWTALLSAPAAEEASRAIEWHIDLQRRLQVLGFLSAEAMVDGIYGTGTRAAISSWQQSGGCMATGFLSNADANALVRQTQLPFPLAVPSPPPVPVRPASIPDKFPVSQDAGSVTIYLTASIEPGDAARFENVIWRIPPNRPVVVLLSSPGGIVHEGLGIARFVHARGFNTHVVGGCYSVCFAIFAAGARRSLTPNSEIGVHSATSRFSDNTSRETDLSFAATMATVRAVQSFQQIPERVLGKLVAAAPEQMAILTPGDLLAMDAVIDPPGTAPVITSAVRQEASADAAVNISNSGGDLVSQWLSAYSDAYSRGYSASQCPLSRRNPSTLPCLAGARDYALSVGAPDLAENATRSAAVPRGFAKLGSSSGQSAGASGGTSGGKWYDGFPVALRSTGEWMDQNRVVSIVLGVLALIFLGAVLSPD